MKYFLDQEFITGFHKPLFGKRRQFIDLISIGIVCEDGRSYYAVSNEFNPKDADDWVKENVLDPIQTELYQSESTYAKTYHWHSLTLKNLLKWHGKSNKQIAEEIIEFVFAEQFKNFGSAKQEFHARTKEYGWNTKTPIEFYGYYADYDWVLFCSLFGRMIDLPKGFPMYCIDLKQMLDEKVRFIQSLKSIQYGFTFEKQLEIIKTDPRYPKQTNEHNALADAKWNFELYKFLNTTEGK